MSESYWGNKSFIVTGGGRGQGAAEVSRLLALGASVVIVDPLPPDSPDWDASFKGHQRVRVVGGGVEKESTWNDALAAAKTLGAPLAGLINNAGISLRKTVINTTLAEWERVMAINLTGAFLGIRMVAPAMVDGGSIVNVSSTAGLTGYFAAAYTASKWGLRGLTKAASIELAARRIRVNAVCPGLIDTSRNSRPEGGLDLAQTQVFFEANRAMTPLSRGGEPDEVAGVVIFLLGPDSAFMTGTDVTVDGGMTGGGMYCQMGRAVGLVQ